MIKNWDTPDLESHRSKQRKNIERLTFTCYKHGRRPKSDTTGREFQSVSMSISGMGATNVEPSHRQENLKKSHETLPYKAAA